MLKKHILTKNYNFIEEAARQLDIHVTEPEDILTLQWKIFNIHAELEDKYYHTGYIADRCTIDSFIYYKEMCSTFQTAEEIVEYRDMVLNRVEDYTHIFYIPIQYPVIDDGFRFANEEFRHTIDYELKSFLYTNDIEYHTLSGKPDMRLRQIENILEERY